MRRGFVRTPPVHADAPCGPSTHRRDWKEALNRFPRADPVNHGFCPERSNRVRWWFDSCPIAEETRHRRTTSAVAIRSFARFIVVGSQDFVPNRRLPLVLVADSNYFARNL